MSKIEWCDITKNPFVGCSHVSSGCKNCYAEKLAASGRLQQFPQYQGVIAQGRWNGTVQFAPDVLLELFRLKRPLRIFMPSMSDPFHNTIPDEWIDQMMAAIALNPRHRFLLLTKRPRSALRYFNRADLSPSIEAVAREHFSTHYPSEGHPLGSLAQGVSLNNLSLGVSVENPDTLRSRMPLFLRLPVKHRFLSCEPLLERIDLTDYLHKIDWVICGGESGPNARPFNLRWAYQLKDQCEDAGVPFFMKQVGSNAVDRKGKKMKTKDTKGGDPSEWPEPIRVRWIA